MSNSPTNAIVLDDISRQVLLLLSTGNKFSLEAIGQILGESINAARYGVNLLKTKYQFVVQDADGNFQISGAGVDYLRMNMGIPAKKPYSTSKESDRKRALSLGSLFLDAIIWIIWMSIPVGIIAAGALAAFHISNLIIRTFIGIGLFVLLIAYLKWSIVPVMEGNKLVLFRWGKFTSTRGPGPVLVVPLFYTTEMVDIRVKEQEISHQTCITQDNVQIDIDFVYYWRIENPEWSLTKVANPQQAIQLLATGILRAVIAKFTFTDVQKNRQTINDKLKEDIDVIIHEWGVTVTSIEIREVKASPEIVRAMEQARTAQWNRETMEILASGEAEALNALRKAAYDLDQNTLNLKYFEVLRKLGEGESTKYIFPMEFSSLVQSWIKEHRKRSSSSDGKNPKSAESEGNPGVPKNNGTKHPKI